MFVVSCQRMWSCTTLEHLFVLRLQLRACFGNWKEVPCNHHLLMKHRCLKVSCHFSGSIQCKKYIDHVVCAFSRFKNLNSLPFLLYQHSPLHSLILLGIFSFLTDALMYIYTSGTTGYPKAAVITHQR